MSTVFVQGAMSNWPVKVATFLEEQARIGDSLPSKTFAESNHVAALRRVAGFLRGLYNGGGVSVVDGMPDELSVLGREVFAITRQTLNLSDYVPSPSAAKVVQSAGKVGDTDSRALVVELLAMELRDYSATPRRAEQARARAEALRDEALQTARNASEQARVQSSAREMAEAELLRVKTERDQLRAQVDFLRSPGRDDSEEPPAPQPLATFPATPQLEEALVRRVRIAPRIYLDRHQGDTWYYGRVDSNHFSWLGSATDGQMSIEQATEALSRLMSAEKQEV